MLSFDESSTDGVKSPLMLGQNCMMEKTYDEITASAIYFFKRSQRGLSEQMNMALDECILALSQVESSKVLRNMRLVIQPDLESEEQAVLSSGKQENRMVAFRSSSDPSSPLQFSWYKEGPECKRKPIILRLLPYVIFGLVLLAIYGFLLGHFVMHDFKVRAQAEGILTVRAFTADVHHDRLNEFYKLPMENSDGMNLYPYKGD